MSRALHRCLMALAAASIFLAPGAGAAQADDDAPLPEGAIARLGTLRFRMNLRFGRSFVALAFAPDGATVLATGDKGLGLWDAATGKPAAGPASPSLIRAAAFRPDGKTFITYGFPDKPPFKQLLQHWQAGTGKLLRQFEVEDPRRPMLAGNGSPAFSPNGEYLIYSNGQEWLVRKTLTGEVHGRVTGELNSWDPHALSPDGKTLAGVRPLGNGLENEVVLYDIPAGKVRLRLHREGCPHYQPRFTPDGKTLVTQADKTLSVWDAATGKLQREIPNMGWTLAFSADGKLLACADRHHIQLYTWPEGALIRRFEGMPGGLYVYALAFSSDGKRLASGHDQMVAIWDVASGKQVLAPEGHQAGICALAFSADGRRLASGSDDDGVACIWDVAERRLRTRLSGHMRAAAAVAFSRDGKTLATGDGSPTYQTGGGEAFIRLWDLESATVLRKFPAHLNGVNSLHFAPDGKTLASGGFDARVRLWNVADGTRLGQVRGGDGFHWARFSPDGKRLLIADSSGTLALWQPDMKQKIHDLLDDPMTSVNAAAFDKSGTRVHAATSRRGHGKINSLQQWESAGGKAMQNVAINEQKQSPMGRPSVFSPDGRLLATTSMAHEDEVLLWDTASGALLARLPTGSWYITALAFSPDGSTLASGSLDTTILLWDVNKAIKKGK